jgi:hypothetical protein
VLDYHGIVNGHRGEGLACLERELLAESISTPEAKDFDESEVGNDRKSKDSVFGK